MLERELARLRRSLAFLESEIQECAGEIRATRARTQAPTIKPRPPSGRGTMVRQACGRCVSPYDRSCPDAESPGGWSAASFFGLYLVEHGF